MEKSNNHQEKKTQEFNRRNFLKFAGGTMAAMTAIPLFSQLTAQAQESGQKQVTWSGSHAVSQYDPSKPIVYFTRDLSPEGVQKIYEKINQGITSKVGIKLHTGELHGPNLLPIEYIKNLQSKIPRSTIVECNVLYNSPRRETKTHRETIKINGFDFCPVDIMDADGDVMLPIPGMKEFLNKELDKFGVNCPFTPGGHLQEIAMGKHVLNYDSLLVYTHFKGHAMGGFGGSLKNIGIGMASGKVGKRMIHEEGWPVGKGFLERMVESGKATVEHFKGHIAYINVLKNISIDCDCDVHGVKPTCDDIGIIGSTDILAADQASIDMIYQLPASQRRDIVERIESRSGLHQLEYMEKMGMGSRQYNLIEI